MNLPLIPPKRPLLQLKKRVVAAPPPPVVAAPVVAPPLKKAPNPPKPAVEKERRRLENMALSALAASKRRADMAKVAPLLTAYLTRKPILSVTVVVDDVECFRPLAVGVRHAVLAWLRTQPETVDCSATVLNDLISLALKPHVNEPKYLAGVLKFDERFDLDGQVCGAVTAKHKANATKKQGLLVEG